MSAKWYKCVQVSHRAYVPIGEEIVMNVNAFVRLPEPVLFEPVKARKAPAKKAPAVVPTRVMRQRAEPPLPPPPPPTPREQLNFLSEPSHNQIFSTQA